MTKPNRAERHAALWALAYGFVIAYIIVGGMVAAVARLQGIPLDRIGWHVLCIPAAIVDGLLTGPLMYRWIFEPEDAR